MTESEMLALLEETFDADEGSLTPSVLLDDLDCWDSVTRLSLIVAMDDEFGKELNNATMRSFSTVGDILDFMQS